MWAAPTTCTSGGAPTSRGSADLKDTSRTTLTGAAAAFLSIRPCRRRPRGPPAAANHNAELVRSLVQQACREALPWMSDLIQPLMGRGDSASSLREPPLPVPPRELSDADGRFVEVDSVSIHYKERAGARPGAPTIVLLHGLNASTFSWRSTVDAVAEATGCRVVAFDRPPFGLTQRPLEWGRPGQALQYNPYELTGSVKLLQGLLARLGVDQVVAVGHSAGALVAMELQRRQPELIAALVLVAPALPTGPESTFLRRATLGQQLRRLLTRAVLHSPAGLAYVRRQVLRRRDEVEAGKLGFTPQPGSMRSFSSGLAPEAEAAAGGRPSAGEGMDGVPQFVIDGYLKPLKAVDWDRAALLNHLAFSMPPAFDYASIAAPVLLVQGRRDGGLSKNSDALAALLCQRSGGWVTEFEAMDCGHAPMDEMPDAFNAALIGFVQRTVLGKGIG